MVRTALARGVEVADLLEAAGLTVATLEESDLRLEAPTVIARWEGLRRRTGDPALQLAAPATLPFGAYRVIDDLGATGPTVGEGLERFARYFSLIAAGVSLRIEPGAERVELDLAMATGSWRRGSRRSRARSARGARRGRWRGR